MNYWEYGLRQPVPFCSHANLCDRGTILYSCSMITRPASRRSAAPTPIGRVDPSGFSRPTSSDSPSTRAAAGWRVPALILHTRE